MGSRIGALKVAAKRLGIPFDEYMQHVEGGEKHCGECRQWKRLDAFHIDKSRGDGRASVCKECRAVDDPRHPWRGKHLPEEHRRKISKTLRERYEKQPHPAKGRRSPKRGLSRTRAERARIRHGVLKTQKYGHEHPNYVDGRTSKTRLFRKQSEYRHWREQVYERDDYTCQHCGDDRGGNLNAHHIKPFAEHPELRLDVSNGITLCEACHIKLHQGEMAL